MVLRDVGMFIGNLTTSQPEKWGSREEEPKNKIQFKSLSSTVCAGAYWTKNIRTPESHNMA